MKSEQGMWMESGENEVMMNQQYQYPTFFYLSTIMRKLLGDLLIILGLSYVVVIEGI